MFRNRLLTSISPLLTLENGAHRQISNPLLNALSPKRNFYWLTADKMKHVVELNTVYGENKMINAVDENSQHEYCIECGRLFTQHPLSQKSNKNHTCIGCARLYGQCRNIPDMRDVVRLVRNHRFSHDIKTHNMFYQQSFDGNEYFTANNFILDQQSKFDAYKKLTEPPNQTAMIGNCNDMMDFLYNDSWKDQNLDLSRLFDKRASNFLRRSKKRYRKHFPQAKLASEKFIFPTKSQVKGFMEASNGKCAWSGIQGFWGRKIQPHTNAMLLLSFDHIIPVSRNGSWNIDNLQIVLAVLNSVKGNEYEEEFLRWFFY